MELVNYNKKDLRDICHRYNLSLVILHGSYTKGLITHNSDIDIGILGESRTIKNKYFDLLNDLSSTFGEKVDPVFLNGAEAMITYHVAISGQPLYEKTKGLFNSFKVGAIARYMDTKKFRVLEKEYIKSVIQDNG